MGDDPLGGGLVDLLVLSAIGHRETYGYAIAAHLADQGVEGLAEASVYAALRRLEGRGLLVSRRALADNGRARRYVALTDDGHRHRKEAESSWTALARAVDAVLASTDSASADTAPGAAS